MNECRCSSRSALTRREERVENRCVDAGVLIEGEDWAFTRHDFRILISANEWSQNVQIRPYRRRVDGNVQSVRRRIELRIEIILVDDEDGDGRRRG